MQETRTRLVNKPVWVDLATPDTKASGQFYSKVLGWDVEVSDDPQYGGYATAKVGDSSVAGLGPKQSDQQPTVWSLYIGTDDIEALARKVSEAGGTVITPPLDIPGQGRMAVFQDPGGAFISSWEAAGMSGFGSDVTNGYGWTELNARGVEQVIPFYESVFGWTHRTSPIGDDQPPYTEFLHDGESIAGAWEMNPNVPADVPAYWLVYFNVDDVDAAFAKAIDGGASEIVTPRDYPGGRFAIVNDPQGAAFGLLKSSGE